MKKTFGTRIQKLSINAGFTCPNRDGTLGMGGCAFCNNNAFNPSYCNPEKSVQQQIKEGISFHQKRYKSAKKYLAYFQAFSNTYGSLEYLKSIYNQVLEIDDIYGIVIGTRPDCMDDEKLNYFVELSEKTYVVLEYGIESCKNETLKRINRGHTFEQTVEAIQNTAEKGIRVGGHMIFGLPGETVKEMLDSASIISDLPLNSIKFHQLQIIKDTVIGGEFIQNPKSFKQFDIEEYLEFMVQYVERLNPLIVIERIAGEAPPRFNLGKRWNLRYDQILNKFEKKLKEKDTWQGKRFGG